MKKETLKLYKENGVWMTQSDNPEWKDLFGTDSVPTCYLSSMAANIVLREIAGRNPDCNVMLRDLYVARRDLYAVKIYNKFEDIWSIEEITDSAESAAKFLIETKKIDPFAQIKIVHPTQKTVDVWNAVGNKIH